MYPQAKSAEHYSRIAPSTDGTGKVYMGRGIAKIMTYHGAEWLERAERAKEERPDLVVAALELNEGMTVAACDRLPEEVAGVRFAPRS